MRGHALLLCVFFPTIWSCSLVPPTPQESDISASLDGQGIQTATSLALSACGQTTQSTEGALEAALRLINIGNYTHARETQGWNDRPPQGGTHPYEWDSVRTADQMLSDRNGGSCGTHGLSIAAITRKAGVQPTEIYVVGAVQIPDYRDICPAADRPRQTQFNIGQGPPSDIHSANGHVFLLVRLGAEWYLFNSTHNPLEGQRGVGQSNQAMCQVPLSRFERVRFQSPADVQASFTAAQPLQIPMSSFPSLVRWMQPTSGGLPGMLIFALWKFEDYPVHTIKDRLNMVASGSKGNSTCRWTVAATPNGSPPNGQNPNGQNPNGQSPNGQNPIGQSPLGPNGQNPGGCRIPRASTISECFCRDGSVDRACYNGFSARRP